MVLIKRRRGEIKHEMKGKRAKGRVSKLLESGFYVQSLDKIMHNSNIENKSP